MPDHWHYGPAPPRKPWHDEARRSLRRGVSVADVARAAGVCKGTVRALRRTDDFRLVSAETRGRKPIAVPVALLHLDTDALARAAGVSRSTALRWRSKFKTLVQLPNFP